MKEWKGLIVGLLLGVLAMLAIGAATMDSNGRYQLDVVAASGGDVRAYMLDTRTGDLYASPLVRDQNVWVRTRSIVRGAKPDTDSAE
jgi:hypothetical protein